MFLLQGPVPTRPTPSPSQSATCRFPLLPAFPAWVSMHLSCPPLRPSCPPWEHTPVSFPRAWGGEGREPTCPGTWLLSACWAELRAVRMPARSQLSRFYRGTGPGGASQLCVCASGSLAGGSLLGTAPTLLFFKQSRGGGT